MPYPYKMIIRIQRMLLGEVEHDVKVTAMGSKNFIVEFTPTAN